MKVLLLHTCGAEASAALADTGLDEAIVAEARMPGRTASERLVAAVRELMEGAGWAVAELGAIAVVSGLGSFTGVRVGLSAAKGLSEASGVPVSCAGVKKHPFGFPWSSHWLFFAPAVVSPSHW